MKQFVLLPICLAVLLSACASPTDPDTPRRRITEPTRYFLGTFHLSEYDEAQDVEELPDGGFIVVGKTWMAHTASIDILLLRTDAEGRVLWHKTFGGVYRDEGYAVAMTRDGGFIITGSTESYTNGMNDLWLIKVDGTGNMQWSQSFGGSSYDCGLDVQECENGGYIAVGYTQASITGAWYAWLLRTDPLGREIWSRRYGGSERDLGSAVRETSDGGFIVTGLAQRSGNNLSAMWLFKAAPDGALIWERTVDGVDSKSGFDLVEAPDGSIAITGQSDSPSAQASGMVFVRLDPAGDVLVDRVLAQDAIGMGIDIAADGSFILCGYTNPYGSDGSDILLLNVESNGGTRWQRNIGGTRLDRAYSVITTSDKGIMVVGSTRSFGHGDLDLLLLKTDGDGRYE